jgi:hypothetical protein
VLTALNDSKVEVRIQFKDVTQGIFKDIARNELVIRIQPNEAVYLKLNLKTPGLYTRAVPTEMDLTYKNRFQEVKIPEAYEALILDTLRGDRSNFVRHDELRYAWEVGRFRTRFLDDALTNFFKRFSHPSCTRSTVGMDLAQSQLHIPTDHEDPRNWMPSSRDLVINELKNLSEFPLFIYISFPAHFIQASGR